MVIRRLNCAEDLIGTANNTNRSGRKLMERRIRIWITFARSSFAYPVLLRCCGLRGLNGYATPQQDDAGLSLYLSNLTHFAANFQDACWNRNGKKDIRNGDAPPCDSTLREVAGDRGKGRDRALSQPCFHSAIRRVRAGVTQGFLVGWPKRRGVERT